MLADKHVFCTDKVSEVPKKILKEIALLVCKMPKLSTLARININCHNVSVLSVYMRMYIAPYHK